MLDHVPHRELYLANNIIRAVTVRVPELYAEVLVGLDEFRSDQEPILMLELPK